jgi:hypothetical protein
LDFPIRSNDLFLLKATHKPNRRASLLGNSLVEAFGLVYVLLQDFSYLSRRVVPSINIPYVLSETTFDDLIT